MLRKADLAKDIAALVRRSQEQIQRTGEAVRNSGRVQTRAKTVLKGSVSPSRAKADETRSKSKAPAK